MTAKHTLSVLFVIFLTAVQPLLAQPCTCTNCPVSIVDNGVFDGTVDVVVNGPNDLGACPLVQVCFTIQHTWIGDLSVSLISPGGQNYLVMADDNNVGPPCGNDQDNVEVCIQPGTTNPLTNNTDYVCNTGGCGLGTCCLTGFWTVPCGGVTDPNTGGVQAPSCDLDDFNTGGSPANGTWTLRVADNCAQDVGLLIDWELTFACGVQSCFTCEADGGVLNGQNVQGCFGDPNLLLNLPPSWPGGPPDPADYGYTYVISQNGTIIGTNPVPDLTTTLPGTYEVCGFSYYLPDIGFVPTLIGMNLANAQALFAGPTAPFCGDFSDDCVEVLIGEIPPPTFIDTMLCLGDCIFVAGQQVCSSTTLTIPSYLGCDSLITVVLIPIPPTTTPVEYTVCQGDCVLVGNDLFCPPGPHNLFLEGWQGCDSLVVITFDEITASAVIIPDPPPALTCSNNMVILDGSLSMPITDIQWEGPNGPNGGNPTLTVTEPGEYTLTVTNFSVNPPCVDSYSVIVDDDTNPPDLEVIDMPQICAGQSYDLNDLTIVDNNGSNAVITFHSATPADASNELPSTLVMPSVTTTYYILGTDGDCTDETSVTVEVIAQPTADFTVISPICLTDFTTVDFIGTADLTSDFIWNFDGGDANPGIGPGPHDVNWADAGTYTISLTVDNNGCVSDEFTATVQVDAPLEVPEIECGLITNNSVEFIWDDVPGNTGYIINVLTGQTGTQNNNTFEVTGLSPGEEVEIEVIVTGNTACGETSAIHSCFADGCDDILIDIDPVADICRDTLTAAFNLNVTVSNSDGTGVGTWSGPGITDPTLGTFDPQQANLGVNTIVYDFTENDCDFSGSIEITIIEEPIAFFSATNVICISDSSVVTYLGNATADAIYTWNFDGGDATSGMGQGPHSVNWAVPGPKTISLIVEENGCVSESFSLNIFVHEFLPEPLLNCNTTLNSVEFIWPDIPNANGYNIQVLTGQTGTMTSDTTFLIDNMTPGEVATVELTVLGNNNCPNTSGQITCEAQDCPPAIVTIDLVADICLDGNNQPINLVVGQSGGNGGGTFTWSGTGITDPVLGTFDPQQANIGNNDIFVSYNENGCVYNDQITITIIDQLTADFTVDTAICSDDVAIVNYTGNASSLANFTWDLGGGMPVDLTGPGPHQVSFDASGDFSISLMVEENGCLSELMTQTVSVTDPIEIPDISCVTNTTSIEFFWNQIPNSNGYTVTVLNGSGGVASSDTSYLFTGLMPNDEITILVEAIADGICPNTASELTCTAQDCPNVDITIDPVDDICLDASAMPVDLTATATGGAGGGSYLWSGIGITDPLNGTFDPSQANLGMNEVSVIYAEATCTYNQTLNINVFAQPSADFTVISPICLDDFTQLEYSGTATSGATFNWTFDGGTPNGGGQGPFAVNWTDSGLKIVTLTVTQNGCVSETMSMDVQVDEPLEMPVINCESTTSTVEFIWQNIPNSIGETITVLSGHSGVLSSDTSYLFTGLMPDEEVIIELEIDGNTVCPAVVVSANCTAQNCPDIQLNYPNIPLVCLDANAMPFPLEIEVSGGDGSGTGMWEGNAITDPILGVFDPALATPGTNDVTYTFTEVGCDYSVSGTVEIVIPPTASFNVDSPICIEDFSEIVFTGTAQPGTVFNWNFGSGTATPGGDIPGPHEVTWPTSGAKTISLQLTDSQGCTSEMFSAEIMVDDVIPEPAVSCFSTTETIEFVWNSVPGSTGFSVNVLTGQSGIALSDTVFLVTGLDPNEEVTLEIFSEGSSACGFTVSEFTCLAIDCPTYHIQIDPVDPVCMSVNGAPAVQLNATGFSGSGVGIWSGVGIISSDLGVFDPVEAGLGQHQITFTYTENNCIYSQTVLIDVFPEPTAEFTVISPICEDDMTTVTYTGNASPGANYSWNFGGGVAIPGTGPGPHQVQWLNSGTKTISLLVGENGCFSPDFIQNVEVDEPLELPVIECNTTTSSIEFFWNDVPGATDYIVTVISGASGTQTSPTTYMVTGLNPFDEVTISVEAVSNNACPNSIVEVTCEAFACPDAVITFDPVDPICLAGDVGEIILNATITGNLGTGAGTWSGGGITDPTNGVFDPKLVGIGIHEVTYTYVENNCDWSENFEIEVTASPMPEVSISNISCFGESDGAISVINSTGGIPPFLYALNGGTLGTETTWTGLTEGDHEILVQDANGCENTLTISLIEPQELNVDLVVFVDNNSIILGDSLDLVAEVSINPNDLDNVIWEPAELVNCDTCLNTSSKPFETTNFTVTVESGPCSDSDDVTILVKKERPIFIPNGFSPNGDGVNDVFMIFSGNQVSKINSFQIFDRWGEPVFERFDFQPNDPTFGWDGTQRGQIVNAAVYVWFAEIEFVDGEIILFEGDVTVAK